jgi:hypothetical protein
LLSFARTPRTSPTWPTGKCNFSYHIIVSGSHSVASLLTVLRPTERAFDFATFVRLDARARRGRLTTKGAQLAVAVYGVGAGAVDPAGTGEGASVEPCVFGGFLLADLFEAGVGDGLLIAAVVVVLVPLVPDCSQDARNAMPIRTAIRENICFCIGYIYFAPRRVLGCSKPNELLGMLVRRMRG